LRLQVLGEDGVTDSIVQFTSLRGEVQAPKTIMHPMAVDLGYVYVGMPVHFEITVENICNIPTKFKLERPGGPSEQVRVFPPLARSVCPAVRWQSTDHALTIYSSFPASRLVPDDGAVQDVFLAGEERLGGQAGGQGQVHFHLPR